MRSGDPARDALWQRAVDGLEAVVELLGGDPAAPRLAETPARFLRALHSLAPPQPPDAPARPERLAALLDAEGPDAPGGPQVHASAATRFSAVCDAHLMPFGGTVYTAHHSGAAGTRTTSLQLDWLAALLSVGLTSERAIAERVVHALRSNLGGHGSACRVAVSRPCPVGHEEGGDGGLRMTGLFAVDPQREDFLAWSGGPPGGPAS